MEMGWRWEVRLPDKRPFGLRIIEMSDGRRVELTVSWRRFIGGVKQARTGSDSSHSHGQLNCNYLPPLDWAQRLHTNKTSSSKKNL